MDTEQLMDELSHCLCSVKTFETEEESWEYTKKNTTEKQFKQIYNILNQIEPLPEPAFFGRVYILSDD